MAFDPDAYLATEDKKKGFDPDAYLAQPTTTARKEQGKALVSLADSAINAATGLLDMAAYVPARAYYGLKGGMTQEQAAAKAQQESTSPKDIIGTYLGYKGQPSYESSPVKQAGEYIGQQLGENVIQPIAQASGIPEPDVGFGTNVALMGAGAMVPKVIAPIKPAIKSGMEFGKGVYSGAFNTTASPTANPGGLKPWQNRSARMPVGDTFIPADVLEQYRAGRITPEEAQTQARPIKDLPQDALARTQGMVPYAGETARATGEQFGAGYRDPYKLAAEAGADYLLGGVPTLGRLGMKAYDAYQLGNAYNKLGKAGFSPLTAEEFSQLQAAGPIRPNSPPPFVGPTMPGPGGLAAATPAAQAAMATTQRVAKPQAQPRPQAQPFTLPDAGTHYAAAEQGSANFADTFNKAVSARTQDLLKNAKQTGQALTPEQAGNLAFDEIKEWRKNNVDAFKPAPQAPELVGPVKPADISAPVVKQEPVYKTAGEMRKALFGKMSPEEMEVLVREKFPAVEPTTPIETPPTKQRDMSLGKADKEFTTDLERALRGEITVEEAMAKYEGVSARKQMRVYNEAYDAAIAEGKTEAQATQAGKQALQRNALPPLTGERSSARLKPKESDIMEREMAQSWFDDTIKNAPDKTTKDMYKEMLAQRNGDVAQLYRDLSAQQAGKTTGKSFFEEPLNTTMPEVEPNAIPENDYTKDLTFAKISGGDLPVGNFEKDGIRYEVVENASYKNMPDDVKKLVPDMPKTIERQIDIKTGKVLKGPKSMAELQAEAEEMLKQSRASKKAATINTTELKGTEMAHGKIPVSGDEYYKHYISGGKTPFEQQYSPGTLTEELYNKVKKDPASLTKDDIKNWYEYDQNLISMPSLKAETKTAKNPKAKTEQEIVAQASKKLADTLIRNYERINNQSSFGRPELVGKSLEEAKAIDAKRRQDADNKALKQNLQEMRTAKENWKAMTEKQRKNFVKKGGRDPSNDIIGGE